MDFYVTDQLLIRYSVIMIYIRKYECIGTVHQLFIDLKIQLERFCTIFGSDMPMQQMVMANSNIFV